VRCLSCFRPVRRLLATESRWDVRPKRGGSFLANIVAIVVDLLLGLKDVVDCFLAAFDHGLVLDGRPAVEDHAGNGRPGLVEETIALEWQFDRDGSGRVEVGQAAFQVIRVLAQKHRLEKLFPVRRSRDFLRCADDGSWRRRGDLVACCSSV